MRINHPVFALSIFICCNVKAQSTIDCSSHRFDHEVFPTVSLTSNIHYGSNIDVNGAVTDLTLDLYEPAGDTMLHRPVIVWAHGGSFLSGLKNDVDVVSLSQHFAKRGYVCISINYRLGIAFPVNQDNATKAVFRAMQDMKAAIRFLRKDAATGNQYKIDPAIIFAGGTSAGAFTALHLAYLNTYAELPSQIDTAAMGDLEGKSGNPGYSSEVNAVIDLCGALGNKTWMIPDDIPFVAMHGDLDRTVPYATALILLLGTFPVMVVDGSYSISEYANTIGLYNEMYTYYGADHVPFVTSTAYMDTTVRFVSNFLYRYLGCIPADPAPLANTFTTGINSSLGDRDFLIYPNPGNGIFNFNFSSIGKEVQLSVFDISGRKLRELDYLENSAIVNLTDFSNGIYFYIIRSKNKYFPGKLIIQ